MSLLPELSATRSMFGAWRGKSDGVAFRASPGMGIYAPQGGSSRRARSA
ncbi:MAG: hypothetical protein AB1717_05640 [Pseudomonadota bacterium]